MTGTRPAQADSRAIPGLADGAAFREARAVQGTGLLSGISYRPHRIRRLRAALAIRITRFNGCNELLSTRRDDRASAAMPPLKSDDSLSTYQPRGSAFKSSIPAPSDAEINLVPDARQKAKQDHPDEGNPIQ